MNQLHTECSSWMRARLRPPKVEIFKEWFELPGRLVHWKILHALRFLVSEDPPLGWGG